MEKQAEELEIVLFDVENGDFITPEKELVTAQTFLLYRRCSKRCFFSSVNRSNKRCCLEVAARNSAFVSV